MKVELSKIMEWADNDPRSVLVKMCEEFVGAIGSCPELQVPDAYPSVRLVLSDEETTEKWGVDNDAVGYFAVMSPCHFDGEDDEDGWYDVNENLEVHLNMDIVLELLRDVPSFDLQSELEAWLVTIPHELLHVVDWMNATGGKTPIEVFDAGRGEVEIKCILEGIEKAYFDAGRDVETEIEDKARQIAERVTNSGQSLAEYADELAPLLRSRAFQKSN